MHSPCSLHAVAGSPVAKPKWPAQWIPVARMESTSSRLGVETHLPSGYICSRRVPMPEISFILVHGTFPSNPPEWPVKVRRSHRTQRPGAMEER